MDVIGDSKIDTLIMKNKNNTEISIFKNGKIHPIIKLYPLIKEEFLTTMPPIEMVYLEANYIQTNNKSLRIKVRNTDLQPDCFFIDISLNLKESYIQI
ncbi:hypothetical protein GV828_09330 [Flavobacterium sp. NST-5]|uniref:Uncharacterized protein n=1 Tax=Flavobacterium ichthyis TaxID=2698827 RepID=A0ABW9ZF54_9FLAO|nr:hypothetical protein [Flavobacterium ichthyis]NBL65398.1 hypothetical protein [Flavobacterium ichthyis]